MATKSEMTFDFDGLIQLLAGHLYSEKKVFIRELIQNAHDAIQRRIAAKTGFERDAGHIDILTDLASNPAKIVFRDNGIGMTESDLREFLSTIGRSGTRAAREEAGGELADVIGQFGIGFLSGFVVGGRVEVRTRHHLAPKAEGCLWENSGRADYTITRVPLPHVGTEVTVEIRSAEDRGLLHEEAVKKVVREYADMLRVPIHLNDPNHHRPPINTMVMPWERVGVSDEEMRLDAMIYLEKTVPDSVLEAIPIQIKESGVAAEGLLYITRTRVLGQDSPRTVRVFLKRMFLCENAKEILPAWATFVNGILNTASLAPNAARDNFTRDEAFTALRDRLEDVIVAHFEKLRDEQPQRLSDILDYHDLALKAACHYHQPFFHKFGHLLEWRINGKAKAAADPARGGRRARSREAGANYSWATLPQILASLPAPPGDGPRRLPCFTTGSSANQYFEMADAAGTTVLDASYHFEAELVKAWAERNRDKVLLVHVDREDDPAVFRPIDGTGDAAVNLLARQMSGYIRPGGTGRLRVEARRFEPATLPAVLKSSEASSGAMKAHGILSDPNTPSDLRSMAEEMLRLSRNAEMRLTINAANPLIRTLADLAAGMDDDKDVNDLMLGVYNDAILYNQELMTPSNAKLFHEQFQRLMQRSLEFIREKASLARDREDLRRQQEAQNPKRAAPGGQARKHLVCFLMTPFNDRFKLAREAVRIVVEDRLGCELRLASDKTFAELIRHNVQRHMDDADFFVADVTGANPNVMMEVGSAFASPRPRPVLLIAAADTASGKPKLPADLEGHIAVTYGENTTPDVVAAALETGFDNNAQLEAMLKEHRKDRFVSAQTLKDWTRGLLAAAGVYDRLSAEFPTISAWKGAKVEQLERIIGSEADLASVALKRITAKLGE